MCSLGRSAPSARAAPHEKLFISSERRACSDDPQFGAAPPPSVTLSPALVDALQLYLQELSCFTMTVQSALQVLDLELEGGDAVTGAALVRGGSKQRLVILTRRRLLSYVLK